MSGRKNGHDFRYLVLNLSSKGTAAQTPAVLLQLQVHGYRASDKAPTLLGQKD